MMHVMTAVIKSIALPDRLTLQYAEQGDPSGVPVILLHGYTDSWRSFEGALPYLPETIHAFALSQRGHGDSDRPIAGYEFKAMVADLVAFMDAIALPSAVIVGHSMGSFVARHFALDYPERTLGLVLIGSFTTYRGNTGVEDLWAAVSQLGDPVDPGFVREFQESTLAQPVPPAFLDTVVQESLKLPARVWRDVLADQKDVDFTDELGNIKAPTLIIWGDQDGLCSRHEQETIRAAIPGSKLVVYPGAGHATHWEEPAAVAVALTAFIEAIVL